MKTKTKTQTQEICFINELEGFKFFARAMQDDLDMLEAWSSRLSSNLRIKPKKVSGLKSGSALAKQVEELRERIVRCIDSWAQALDSSAPMRKLSEHFGDKAVLLVFGKVNAGKSSFCNFLADRFAHHGENVQYFYLEGEAIVDTTDRFVEGATETTARIQGIKLGEKLILLDTPGLHSVTPENGALTRRFTNSADGVLWLTSSTSPGQVQELDELRVELASRKPLLPVITKSDMFVEDEVDGEIVRALHNKTVDNRTLQEGDVLNRAQEKLRLSEMDTDLVRRPLSVSVYVARSSKEKKEALEHAGFERLFESLLVIAKSARKYKEGKAVELRINHLENTVFGSLQNEIRPQLKKLTDTAQSAAQALDARGPRIASSVVSEVLGELANLLEHHKKRGDAQAVYRDLSTLCKEVVAEHIARELKEYAVEINAALLAMNGEQYGGFDDVTEEYEVVKGRWKKAAASGAAGAAGAAIGGVIGSVFFPGAGTVLGVGAGEFFGGLLGGAVSTFLGEKGGDYFVETERKRVAVGVSYERLYGEIETDLRKRLPGAVTSFVNGCKESIEQAMHEVQRVDGVVVASEQELKSLKKDITRESI